MKDNNIAFGIGFMLLMFACALVFYFNSDGYRINRENEQIEKNLNKLYPHKANLDHLTKRQALHFKLDKQAKRKDLTNFYEECSKSVSERQTNKYNNQIEKIINMDEDNCRKAILDHIYIQIVNVCSKEWEKKTGEKLAINDFSYKWSEPFCIPAVREIIPAVDGLLIK